MIRLHMTRGDRATFALLSGDAGCGKSYAISMLATELKALKISVRVSAMTNKAVGSLTESCPSLHDVLTFHKMMGLKKELLDDRMSLQRFEERYRETYRDVILHFKALCDSDDALKQTHERHSCARLRPESCAVCSSVFRALTTRSQDAFGSNRLEGAPPFLGSNVLVVDEYGLMTVDLFERMLLIMSVFYGPDRGPLVIFVGSVSQLQPAGPGVRLWANERFETLVTHRTPLLVNRRQFQDPGYAEALAYLQFNTVTEESRSIFKSRVLVDARHVTDPGHEPEKL
ncbi:MAG: AAA family ATPase, partial [Myxococcota bacterium]